MPTNETETPTTAIEESPDQETRIKHLREELEKLGGETIQTQAMPADMEEEFLRHVLEYERAEPITPFKLLENAGFYMPAPESLDDGALATMLTNLAPRLATMGVYLLHTDHVSDRALYESLYNEHLREEAVLFPENPSYAYIIDLTGSGSEEDNMTYLRYYADEEHRKQWAADWPDDVIPPHEARPFDRDKTLPKSPLG